MVTSKVFQTDNFHSMQGYKHKDHQKKETTMPCINVVRSHVALTGEIFTGRGDYIWLITSQYKVTAWKIVDNHALAQPLQLIEQSESPVTRMLIL